MTSQLVMGVNVILSSCSLFSFVVNEAELKKSSKSNRHATKSTKATNTSPPPLGGGMFVNFFILNHVCQLCQRMAKYAIPIGNLYRNT